MSKFLSFVFGAILLIGGTSSVQATSVADYYANDETIEVLFDAADVVEFSAIGNQLEAVASNALSQNTQMDVLSPKGDDKIIAFLLAFFLGGFAIHRVYLGSTPMMVLYYIITCGGIFGIVPTIDWIMILVRGIDSYIDSDKFFSF